MSFIDLVRERYSCAIINPCKEMGCEIKLSGYENYIILKGEKICQNGKMCDCIIIIESKDAISFIIVELKNKCAKVSDIEEKFDRGFLKISELEQFFLSTCKKPKKKCKIFPVIIVESWRVQEKKMLKSRRIPYKGHNYDIYDGKCNSFLKDIMLRQAGCLC